MMNSRPPRKQIYVLENMPFQEEDAVYLTFGCPTPNILETAILSAKLDDRDYVTMKDFQLADRLLN